MALAQGLFKMDRIFVLEMFGCQFQISLSLSALFIQPWYCKGEEKIKHIKQKRLKAKVSPSRREFIFSFPSPFFSFSFSSPTPPPPRPTSPPSLPPPLPPPQPSLPLPPPLDKVYYPHFAISGRKPVLGNL